MVKSWESIEILASTKQYQVNTQPIKLLIYLGFLFNVFIKNINISFYASQAIHLYIAGGKLLRST